jgi:hypothetical protein
MIKGILAILAFFFLYGIFAGDSDTKTASTTTVEPKFKCLSAWDGSYGALKSYTKKAMKDPKSFEHRETRITPIVDGYQNVFMTYAGKNSFGGMVVERIGAKIRNSDCSLITVINL